MSELEELKLAYAECSRQRNELLNKLKSQAQQQEPVAYGMWDTMLGKGNRMMMVRLDKGQDGCTVPLYTSPQPAQRKPLDAGEISRLWKQHTSEDGPHLNPYDDDGLGFARAIEAKLKEKNT